MKALARSQMGLSDLGNLGEKEESYLLDQGWQTVVSEPSPASHLFLYGL